MCVIWGIPYLMIRVAVRELAPVTLVFFRTALAAMLLLPFALWRKELRALLPHWRALLLYTGIEVALPWFLLAKAEIHLSSSLTGLLIAAVPLVGAVVAGADGRAGAAGRPALARPPRRHRRRCRDRGARRRSGARRAAPVDRLRRRLLCDRADHLRALTLGCAAAQRRRRLAPPDRHRVRAARRVPLAGLDALGARRSNPSSGLRSCARPSASSCSSP